MRTNDKPSHNEILQSMLNLKKPTLKDWMQAAPDYDHVPDDPFAGSEWTGAKQGTTQEEKRAITTAESGIPDKVSQPNLVQVQVKTQYGVDRFYPMDRTGEWFLSIQGGKTLTEHTLRAMMALGYEIKFNHKEVVL